MMTLFYSPHSTSTDNEAGRASGHADAPLSAKGWEGARQLGEMYAGQSLDAVFCSDLQRAYSTAETAFSTRNLPIVRDARLRECDYGKQTQCPVTELKMEQHIFEPYPDGESVFMVMQRVGAFLHDILPDYDEKTVVVISHSAVKRGLDYLSADTSLEEIMSIPWKWREVPIWRYEFKQPLRTTLSATN
jgi:broad specificity phosphatase PhoE